MTDDFDPRQAQARMVRAVAGARSRDRWNRTHCSATLTHDGRGVGNTLLVVGRAHVIGELVWSLVAIEGLHPSPANLPPRARERFDALMDAALERAHERARPKTLADLVERMR